MSDHQPIQPELHDVMNTLARVLSDILKPYGFALLVFEMDSSEGRMNYISNAERETMLIAMKEFIANNEARRLQSDAVQ